MFSSRLSIQFSIEFLFVFYLLCHLGSFVGILVEYKRGGGISGAIVVEYHSAIFQDSPQYSGEPPNFALISIFHGNLEFSNTDLYYTSSICYSGWIHHHLQGTSKII